MRLDPIVIVVSDPQWPADLNANASGLLRSWARCLPCRRSTSEAPPCRGFRPRQIIDVLAVVTAIDEVMAVIPSLEQLGWIHAPEPGDDEERRLSYCFPSIERRSHHLHIVEEQFPHWRGWLAFRDLLRATPAVAQEYAALKRTLAAGYGTDRNRQDAYRAGKSGFVRQVTTVALIEREAN